MDLELVSSLNNRGKNKSEMFVKVALISDEI